jgi:phosphoribosyl 1,2-cyclic phosphate phosphodiesterase
VPLYCTADVEKKIRQSFSYAFTTNAQTLPAGFVPQLAFRTIAESPFTVLGQRVQPIPLVHAHFDVFGFRFDDVAYCTDVNQIPERSWPLLEGLNVLVLDALRFKAHPGHFSIAEALEVIERVRPKRAYLTHMSHDLDHETTNRMLPPHVELAYDGLSFNF